MKFDNILKYRTGCGEKVRESLNTACIRTTIFLNPKCLFIFLPIAIAVFDFENRIWSIRDICIIRLKGLD